jgi:hypothetical protein
MKVNSPNFALTESPTVREFSTFLARAPRKTNRILHRKLGPLHHAQNAIFHAITHSEINQFTQLATIVNHTFHRRIVCRSSAVFHGSSAVYTPFLSVFTDLEKTTRSPRTNFGAN